MAKFQPEIGEGMALLEITIKGIGAGIAAILGDEKSKDELLEGARNAWVDYSETNFIASPIRRVVHHAKEEHEESRRVKKRYSESAEEFVDNFPVDDYGKGAIHYLKGASRSQAVIGAAAVTAGVAAPVMGLAATAAVGASTSLGTGLVMDGTTTIIDSAVHKERHPAGFIGAVDKAKKTGNKSDLVDAILIPVADAVSGALEGISAKNAYTRSQIGRQRATLRNGIGEGATKDVTDTGRHFEKVIKDNDIQGGNHVMNKLTDKQTGKVHHGVSGRARRHVRAKNNIGEMSVLGKESKHLSELQQRTKTGIPKGRGKSAAHRSCAEHSAYEVYYTKPSNPTTKMGVGLTETNSINFDGSKYTTIRRCKNCLTYADAMGKAPTGNNHPRF